MSATDIIRSVDDMRRQHFRDEPMFKGREPASMIRTEAGMKEAVGSMGKQVDWMREVSRRARL